MRKPYMKLQHKILQALAFLQMIGALVTAIVFTVTIKEPIPMHYDLDGTINNYGKASGLLPLPIIMLVVMGIVALVADVIPADKWNMPFKVRPEKLVTVYSAMMSMLSLDMFLLGAIVLSTTIIMGVQAGGVMGIVVMIFIGLMFLNSIFWIAYAWKKNREP